jgi:hypothetical protein
MDAVDAAQKRAFFFAPFILFSYANAGGRAAGAARFLYFLSLHWRIFKRHTQSELL